MIATNAPKTSLADSAMRAQKFWDAGVTNWDGDSFKSSENNMRSLFGKLRSVSSVQLEEENLHDDATYSNMMQEEMAMADIGFEDGYGHEDTFTEAAQNYHPNPLVQSQ